MADTEKTLYQIDLSAESIPAGVARVLRLTCREALSQPYKIDVDIVLPPGTDFDPRTLLNRPVGLAAVRIGDGTVVRRFAGIVTRTRERVSRSGKKVGLGLTIEPSISVLRLFRDHRIFQEKDTKTIVQSLLDETGCGGAQAEFRLTGSYLKREVCTQFGEVTLDFVSRLLEEEGIYYYHEQREDGAVLVIADSASGYAETTPESAVSFRGGTGLISDTAISELWDAGRVHAAKVTLRDHDFKKPSLDLTAEAESDAPLGRERYEYPGFYVDPGEGKRRAQAYLDALHADAVCLAGKSDVFSLTAGHTFELSDAPDDAWNRKWVIRDIEHTWQDEGGVQKYENRFHLLPDDVDYRPLRRTKRPLVPGPQLAHVTGPSGEEIHPDEHGRVKVHFPWDRYGTWDDKSSCWVRVGQLHSSGSVAIPRVGWEVLVAFEDGNPDKPIVLGRLYNGRYGPPVGLPDKKMASMLQSASSPGGGGYNQIVMDDGAGSESFSMQAQKDMNVHVANNKTEKIATTSVLGIGSNHKLTVGANETLSVGASSELMVGGSQKWTVGASRTVTVSGDQKIDIAGSRSMTIGGSHTTMTPMSASASTPATFSETIGGSGIEAAALGVMTMVAGSASVTVGGAKIDAVATGYSDTTIGAKATTVGGAFIGAAGKDVSTTVGGAKATTVGGAWVAAVGGDFEFSAGSSLNISVGGAVAMNAAKIVLKVGGSTVTMQAGSVVLKSSTIKLTATGPQPELAPLVSDK